MKSSNKLEENDIGKSVFDFKVLELIGKDKYSSLLKVRSKKNNQIYVMKKCDLEKAEKEGLLNYFQNEGEVMQSLDNENICKCYKSFMEGNSQYIILEYVDGENLLSFFNANNLMGLAIKEEKLMKIFLGCLNGLQYIHSKEIIHRNIKPINIIMDDNGNIKIIDFKFASKKDDSDSKKLIIGGGNFLAPELSGDGEYIDYDNKVDVYSMGATFCSLAYYRTSLPNSRGNISEELYKIIKNMLERDPKNRPSSSEVYNDLKSLYIKKNNDKFISSLSSSIRSLASFPNFYEDLNNQNINDSMPMSKQFSNCIKLLKEFTSSQNDKEKEKKWNIALYDFKEFLLKDMNYNEEIEPIHIISFILRAMHKELNVSNNNIIVDLCKQANKEEAYKTFVNYYNERFKSFISDRFFGTIKTKSMCRDCKSSDYFFHYLYLIPFNIKILSEKCSAEKKEGLNIYDAFNCLNRNFIENKHNKFIPCKNCQKYPERNEFKQFYNLSNDLILFFDRGEKCKYKTFVNFEDKLNLKGNNVEKFNCNPNGNTYDLYCIISRIEVSDKSYKKKKKEKYIVYTKDSKENKYINNNDGESCDLKEIKTYGDIIALFYYCKEIIDSKDKSGIDNSNPNENINMNDINNINNNNNISNINNNNINNINNNINYISNNKMNVTNNSMNSNAMNNNFINNNVMSNNFVSNNFVNNNFVNNNDMNNNAMINNNVMNDNFRNNSDDDKMLEINENNLVEFLNNSDTQISNNNNNMNNNNINMNNINMNNNNINMNQMNNMNMNQMNNMNMNQMNNMNMNQMNNMNNNNMNMNQMNNMNMNQMNNMNINYNN